MAIQHTPTLQLPYPQSTDSADVPRDIKALADAIDPLGIAPVGALLLWPAVTAPTDADGTGRALWLLCNGQVVLAATYPKLATILGQAAGNITVPDYRDTFPVGAGPTMALGSRGGAASVALTTAQLPSHNHTGVSGFRDRAQSHAHAINGAWMLAGVFGNAYPPAGAGMTPTNLTTETADAPDHKHTIPAEGGGGTHENRPPFLAINFIIRAG
jgi:microcystin-dependent protein